MKAKKSMSKELQRKLLGTVVEFMARAGVSDAAIEEAFRCGLKKSRDLRSGRGAEYADGSYLQNGDVSADLLRAWHRDGRYISDVDAAPRPLQLLKGKNSIRAIILSLHKKVDVSSVITFLKDAKLIKRTPDGRYLPTAEAGTITQNDSFVVEHLVKSVVRLFNTMRRNTSAAGRKEPLIERYAYVSDLNPSDRKSFAEFTRLQGMAYLQAVDDWMEQRRVIRMRSLDRRGQKGVVAGVHVVAYLGDRLPEGNSAVAGLPVRTKGLAARRRVPTTSPPSAPA
ncbi:MAG TPA: hypothetical protein VNQ32_14910 [Steroidobacteraceae bacterium]|nr:hypothetical protein [Steroidobacteraceae bacterium]